VRGAVVIDPAVPGVGVVVTTPGAPGAGVVVTTPVPPGAGVVNGCVCANAALTVRAVKAAANPRALIVSSCNTVAASTRGADIGSPEALDHPATNTPSPVSKAGGPATRDLAQRRFLSDEPADTRPEPLGCP